MDSGHHPFLDADPDHGIAPGDDWQRRLHERLRWADVVLCVITSAYAASAWCSAEAGIADFRGSRVIPVQLEAGVRHPVLQYRQHLDLTGDRAGGLDHLAAALQQVDAAGGYGWPDDRSPFPGLRPFGVDEHGVFFGREQDGKNLETALRSTAARSAGGLLVVLGPSGCGKSSLVRAGLLHRMADDDDWLPTNAFRPGGDPLRALARELVDAARRMRLTWGPADVYERLRGEGLVAVADELLQAPSGPRRHHLLVLVDQLEELLTRTPPHKRADVARLLRPLADSPVQVVATLRSEFLDDLLTDPFLAGLPLTTHLLRPLRPEALRDVVSRPAETAGLTLDEHLLDRLVADTAGGEALPLLAYTLAQLADGVRRGGRLLADRYDELGGVSGALARQAEKALSEAIPAGGRSGNDVVEELLRLVAVDELGRPTRRRVRRSDLPAHAEAEFAPFIDLGLLTTDRENDAVVVGVSHEAFLKKWPPLAEAIADNTESLRAAGMVERDAELWCANGRPADGLWDGRQLAGAVAATGARLQRGTASRRPWRRRTLVTDRVELGTSAREFLRAGIRRDRRRRRRATTVLSVLLVVALTAAGVAYVQWQAVEDRQRLATARLLAGQADALLPRDPRTALQLGEAAAQLNPSVETRSALARNLLTTPYRATLSGGIEYVAGAAFAPDGRTLAVGGPAATTVLWDVAAPGGPRRIGAPVVGHEPQVPSGEVAFSPDGRTLATDEDGAVLWDVTDLDRPRRLDAGVTGYLVGFAPVGHTLVTLGERSLQLWDVTDPAHARPLGPPLTGQGEDGPSTAAFTTDGRTLVTGGEDGTVALWDLADPARPRRWGEPVSAHTGRVKSVAFEPDGRTVATTGGDSNVLLWDVTDRARPRGIGRPLAAHANWLWGLAFAPVGHVLATAGADGTAVLWDVTDPAAPQRIGEPLAGRSTELLALAFAPDGRTLATGARDVVALWNVGESAHVRVLGPPLAAHSDGVTSVTFAPDGRTLATGSRDGTAVLWNVVDPDRPARLGRPITVGDDAGRRRSVFGVQFGEGGRTAVLDTGGGSLLVDLADLQNPRPVAAPPALHVALSPTGHLGVAVGTNGRGLFTDLTDPAHPVSLGDPIALHDGEVDGLTFSPDGRLLVVTGVLRGASLWDVTDPAAVRKLADLERGGDVLADLVKSAAFASDGRLLALGDQVGNVSLWNLTDPQHPVLLGDPLAGHAGAVGAVAISPDGRTLATAGDTPAVALWDITDAAHPRSLGSSLVGHTGRVRSVAFSPDGRMLATAAEDRTARLWDLGEFDGLRDDPVGRACGVTDGGLDPDQWARYVPGLTHTRSCL